MNGIKFTCSECKKENSENPSNVLEKQDEINGQLITLKYYNCQVCKAPNYVQVDNDETMKRLAECKAIIKEKIVSKGLGKNKKKVNKNKLKKKTSALEKYRRELISSLVGVEYNGKEFHMTEYKIEV